MASIQVSINDMVKIGDWITFEKYGADGVRMGILISSPAGNDLPIDSSQCEQGRNFANKIWNAFRLVKGWEEKVDKSLTQSQAAKTAVNCANVARSMSKMIAPPNKRASRPH